MLTRIRPDLRLLIAYILSSTTSDMPTIREVSTFQSQLTFP
jgi:hypothetical protein